MSRWYLIAIANYIFILGHAFFLIAAFVFSAGISPPGGFLLFMLCLAIIIFNSAFNLYIFHGYMPGKKIKEGMKRKYIISTTLFIAAFIGLIYTLVTVISDEDIGDSDNGFASFLKWTLILNFIIGLFILINQFSVIKFIEKISKD
ncbi:MAG TPA: hypothetical protein PKC72_05385 [Chitinophagaceae bacterium]|nr:hypothetical protein [Chitinophagaceae bacterium]